MKQSCHLSKKKNSISVLKSVFVAGAEPKRIKHSALRLPVLNILVILHIAHWVKTLRQNGIQVCQWVRSGIITLFLLHSS